MTDRRFIEESFPVKEVSAISAREKNIRHGHISTLHIWWARRPLAASRATAYAALTPATDDVAEWQRRRDFIVELSRWENSLNPRLLEKARRDILERIVPLVIKERYLWEQEYVLTEQLAQAGLRTPGEARVVSQEAWEQGIAEGVHQGLFGLGTLEDDQPMCRYFGEKPFVGLAGSEAIIRAEICQAQREAEAEQPPYRPPEEVDVTMREPGLVGAGEAPEVAGAEVGRRVPLHLRRRLQLQFTVPRGKVSGLMGVMNLLQHKFDRLDIVLSAEHGEISEQEYEDKIQEAFRQLGIEVLEE